MADIEEFHSPVDIANFGIDALGAENITAFDQSTKEATRFGQNYNKLRRAELRRNVWTFATRRTVIRPNNATTRLFAPAAWDAAFPYNKGQIASYNGEFWVASLDNINTPPTSGETWDIWFGTQAAQQWVASTGYYPGELVYVSNGGKYTVYACQNQYNQLQPNLASAWDSTVIYTPGQVVTDPNGYFYMSLIDFNLGNTPDVSTPQWQDAITYAKNATVTGADGRLYLSLAGGNVGVQPVGDATGFWEDTGNLTPWTPQFSGSVAPPTWVSVEGTLTPITQLYPVMVGASVQNTFRSVYKLPNGFLRKAPQDPKAGSIGFLGAPTGNYLNDWLIENGLLVTRYGNPIALRFVADVQNVEKMDPMFCVGLGLRMARDLCEVIKQDAALKQTLTSDYRSFFAEARVVNGIEASEDFPPEDEFIAVRY